MSIENFSGATIGSGDVDPTGLSVPQSLQDQLHRFRRHVWTIKMLEAAAIVVAGLCAAFLTVYVWDRFRDTPAPVRGGLLIGGGLLLVLLPVAFYRWVWKYRGLEPLARLLGKRLPAVGDQLLGVIELTHSESEQARSMTLCRAAMGQVAHDAAGRDLNAAAPPSYHRWWSAAALVTAAAVVTLWLIYPAASSRTAQRLIQPWKDISRYTFTTIAAMPNQWIIPHGETTPLRIELGQDSRWQPTTATIVLGDQAPIIADLVGDGYQFDVPPQISDQPLSLVVGDYQREITVRPTLRPELSGLVADVQLPDYLGHDKPRQIDSRGGSLAVVRGSIAMVTATANRDLAEGKINDLPHTPSGTQLVATSIDVDHTPNVRFQWKDQDGLSGREPFDLSITPIDDQAPTLICDGIPRQGVVLDSETLKFSVRASDDFGIQKIGLSWRGLDRRLGDDIAKGERPLAAGDHQSGNLEAIGTFNAKSFGVSPQPIEVLVWAEDYLPGRDRIYSPPHILYVLSPNDHAIWMTEQLSKWHRQALELRDRERQLHAKNIELRSMSPEELQTPEIRRQLRQQSSAERAGGRRLDRLGELGDQLIQTASRNPEIGVGHLERWAEMMQVLKDLAGNRMPSVADLLDSAADEEASKITASSPTTPVPKRGDAKGAGGPKAGQSRDSAGAKPPSPPLKSDLIAQAAPTLADMESSMASPDENAGGPGASKKPSNPALRLPVTTVAGKSKKTDPPKTDADDNTQQQQLTRAIEEQRKLLAEFDRLAEELNTVLANLEGSTLVKRLKAASRRQYEIAGGLIDQVEGSFGMAQSRVQKPVADKLTQLQQTEKDGIQSVSYIMDDLSAYFDRRPMMQFKNVLDEMKSSDVLGGMRSLVTDIASQQGLAIASSEFWADSMDRWAENLVDPACNGSCPGGKSPASLPPSIVLEFLQILEGEINLREETRVAEQAKPAMSTPQYEKIAATISESQITLNQRIVDVIGRINELQDAAKHFGKELEMLAAVDAVMSEASGILATPQTGPTAIAAETEAIELMLRSKRINPGGGGGGGSSPGGGGSGGGADSALALVGKGVNSKEVREDHGITQTTGESGRVLPEEFRHGLDQYFNRLGGT